MSFNAGDVVRLKSGGPKMTVDVAETVMGKVYCIWFEGVKKYDGDFQPEALELAKDGPASVNVKLSRA